MIFQLTATNSKSISGSSSHLQRGRRENQTTSRRISRQQFFLLNTLRSSESDPSVLPLRTTTNPSYNSGYQTWWHTLWHACLTNRILYLPRIFSSPRELQPTTSRTACSELKSHHGIGWTVYVGNRGKDSETILRWLQQMDTPFALHQKFLFISTSWAFTMGNFKQICT